MKLYDGDTKSYEFTTKSGNDYILIFHKEADDHNVFFRHKQIKGKTNLFEYCQVMQCICMLFLDFNKQNHSNKYKFITEDSRIRDLVMCYVKNWILDFDVKFDGNTTYLILK